ncbi:hypothetical protein BDN72DRAFT_830335 [Pluteus cervinus]|uniref:Uncharacterized protein n=1 Tax=Pluteus cervinus TaxID=181527 RepID=A0ACD3BH07_9AGAR|nr:hypothetical protein BDN72DRAFT_830335 [Pluteus cervinus]
MSTTGTQEGPAAEEKQCRICLDGTDSEPQLGRLIRPCLCKGSISYVHIKCLHQWRKVSSSPSAFFQCPQCHYQYRFSRTQIVGIATNPVVVGGISGLLFTFVVMMASYLTTYSMSVFEEPSTSSFYYTVSYSGGFYSSPFSVISDLVRAALRILQDGDVAGILEITDFAKSRANHPPLKGPRVPEAPPGLIKRFVRRFVLGLPIVGAGSLVQMLLSMPFIGPVHWLARYRGNRRRGNSNDFAALLIVALLVLGALRALYKVYKLTETLTKRVLLRAEDAILEVG